MNKIQTIITISLIEKLLKKYYCLLKKIIFISHYVFIFVYFDID